MNDVNQSATQINDEKHIINIEGEFSKSQNEQEGSNQDQMKMRVIRNTVIQNDSKTDENVQFFNIVKTDTLSEINENRDNTEVKGNQEECLENKFSENQLILKYMHKKFGQVNLKRKRSLEEDLDRNIAAKSGLNPLAQNR